MATPPAPPTTISLTRALGLVEEPGGTDFDWNAIKMSNMETFTGNQAAALDGTVIDPGAGHLQCPLCGARAWTGQGT